MMSADMTYLVVLVLVVFLYPDEGQGFQYFTQSPRNQTAYEGSRVRFTCESEYMTSCWPTGTHPRFFWYRSITYSMQPSYVGSCLGVTYMTEQMTTEFDTTNKQFHLVINDVQLHDAGEYWCVYYYEEHGQSSQKSLKASLTVRRPGRPSCMVTHPLNPRVGETVFLKCTLADDHPRNILTWYVESSPTDLDQVSPSHETQRRRVAWATQELQATDNMKKFVCVAGPHTTSSSSAPQCSVTPLQIHVPTGVSISPTSKTVHEGDSAVFTCEAMPLLIADEYIWRINKTDGSQVTINRATLTGNSFATLFNISRNILEIPAVSLDFHNSEVGCTADYRGIYSNSLNRSLLKVLSTGTLITITQSVPKDDTETQKLPIGIIIGGTLAILLLLVVIFILICFLVRSKREVKRPRQVQGGNPVQESRRQDRVIAGSSVEADVTYLNLPRDDQSHLTQPNLSGETTECETVLYTLPDKTRSGEVKHFTMPPPANKINSSHRLGSLPSDLESASSWGKNGHGSHEMVVYAEVNENIKRYPKPSADKPAVGNTREMASSLQDQASQGEHIEENEYADMSFNQVSQGAAGIDAIYATPNKSPKK